jgi:hypothetical protein
MPTGVWTTLPVVLAVRIRACTSWGWICHTIKLTHYSRARARDFGPARHFSDLILIGQLNASKHERRALSRHNFLSVGLAGTVKLPDLFRPAFLCSFPVLRGNGIWIDQLLSKAGRDEKG